MDQKDKPPEKYIPATPEEIGQIDEEDIKKFYKNLRHKYQTEIRAINPFTDPKFRRSYHFSTEEELIKICKDLNGKANLYLGINERSLGGSHKNQVISVGTIPFDLDCVAKPASQEDLELAKEVAEKIISDMERDGFKRPTYVLSGNGYQLFFMIPPIEVNEKNFEEVEDKIEDFGKLMMKKYSTDKIRLDNIYDLPRIMRIPGTFNLKSKTISKIISYKDEEDFKLKEFILNRPQVEKDIEKLVAMENEMINSSSSGLTVDDLSVSNIFGTAGLKLQGSEYRGSHPVHGSTSGENFNINTSKNTWHCFRCNSGGGPLSAVGVKEGLIDCSDARPGQLRGKIAREALKLAEEKYGAKKPNTLKNAAKIFGMAAQVNQFVEEQPLFYDKAGLYWLWDHDLKYWKMTDEIDLLNKIQDSVGADIITSKMRNELINSFKQCGRRKIPNPAPKSWIQFKNGLVDISSGKMIAPSTKYFITNPIPWDISNDDKTPNMDRIFEQWVGSEYVPLLYQILAFCLICDYPINRIFAFVGSGLNGKSKYLELLRKFIGEDNCTSTELDTLLVSRFEITRLHKKLVCMMGETNFTELSKTAILKKITGNDLIGFEYKNKNTFDDTSYAKILISTNNLPTTSDKTVGFYRRWLIVDFPNQFTEAKDILSEIPDEEYENLAKKCIPILREVLSNRAFHMEGTIEERMKRFEERSNPFDKFWKECIEEDYDSFISKRKFTEELNKWCKANRFREMADITISKHMALHGIEEDRKVMDWVDSGTNSKPRYRVWIGIKLK